VECRVGKGSDEGNGGARNEMGGENAGQGAPIQWSIPSMLSIAEREGGKESGME